MLCSYFSLLISISEDALLTVVFKIDTTGVVWIFIPIISGIVLERFFDCSGDESCEPEEDDPLSVLLISARVRCFFLLLEVGDVP